jgi:hypothetical protein
MKSTIGPVVISAAILLRSFPAQADVVPPEVAPCQGKQAGDACVYNGAGICANQTCNKLDYTGKLDGSTGPSTIAYTCLSCMIGTDAGSGPHIDSGSSPVDSAVSQSNDVTSSQVASDAPITPADAPITPARGDAATTPAVADAAATMPPADAQSTPSQRDAAMSPATSDAGAPPPEHASSACSVGKHVAARRVGPWVLASAFSLLFLFGRRRRR